MRSSAPIHVVVHFPTTESGREELAKRVADAHAAAVNQKLKRLKCPTSQKLALIDAVVETVNARNPEPER